MISRGAIICFALASVALGAGRYSYYVIIGRDPEFIHNEKKATTAKDHHGKSYGNNHHHSKGYSKDHHSKGYGDDYHKDYYRVASPRELPKGNLIIGYAIACNPDDGSKEKILVQAIAGVNVIIWFSTNLESLGGVAGVVGGPNHTCVAEVAKVLREKGLKTAHMISIGGWNAPHPNTIVGDGATWAAVWQKWNAEEVAKPDLGFPGYDGVDWDLEGNDDKSSPFNHFSVACMELVGEMSQTLKREGYLVSLVPPQSYFDVTTSNFDLSLLHSYADFHPEFDYHGYNAYTLWYSKYGRASKTLSTFDFVDVQFYETFSRACQALTDGEDPVKYLVKWIRQMESGWRVDFSSVKEMGWKSSHIKVPAKKLVLGFWFGDPEGRVVFFDPSSVEKAWAELNPSERPRGVMFWNMNTDPSPAYFVNGTSAGIVNFAQGFNSFLHVRPRG